LQRLEGLLWSEAETACHGDDGKNPLMEFLSFCLPHNGAEAQQRSVSEDCLPPSGYMLK
jgi:hypothetical protein